MIPPGAPWGSYTGDSYPGGSYSLDIEQMRAALARAGRRIMLAFTLVTGGALLLLALLLGFLKGLTRPLGESRG